MSSDLPGSVGTGDSDLRVKFPMSIPTSILATTHGLALLVSSLTLQLLFLALTTKSGVRFDSLNLLAEHPTEMFILYLSTVEFSVEGNCSWPKLRVNLFIGLCMS
jgi:hypothetical protein